MYSAFMLTVLSLVGSVSATEVHSSRDSGSTGGAYALENRCPGAVRVRIAQSGQGRVRYQLDGREYSERRLTQALRVALKRASSTAVVVECNATEPYGATLAVVNAARDAGAVCIELAGGGSS
jgi:biopolymer transport protein ExbD